MAGFACSPRLFKSALAIDPQYYEVSNNLALEYFAVGNSELALQILRDLIKSDPKHVLAYDNLAILLCRLCWRASSNVCLT
jgi:tetratricopeptide (TPR) repeat protein